MKKRPREAGTGINCYPGEWHVVPWAGEDFGQQVSLQTFPARNLVAQEKAAPGGEQGAAGEELLGRVTLPECLSHLYPRSQSKRMSNGHFQEQNLHFCPVPAGKYNPHRSCCEFSALKLSLRQSGFVFKASVKSLMGYAPCYLPRSDSKLFARSRNDINIQHTQVPQLRSASRHVLTGGPEVCTLPGGFGTPLQPAQPDPSDGQEVVARAKTEPEDGKHSAGPKPLGKRHSFSLIILSFQRKGEAGPAGSGQGAFQHPVTLTCTSKKLAAGALPSCPEDLHPCSLN